MVRASDGKYYGTTAGGGLNAMGTVFRITEAGAFQSLVDFTGQSGVNKGSSPATALVLGSDGELYGTTTYGGMSNLGTVFKLNASGTLTTLTEFTGSNGNAPGNYPTGLVEGAPGYFYGTTGYNGGASRGTVFRMTTAGEMTPIHDFNFEPVDNSPEGPLTLALDGNLYGTTASGAGGVFRQIGRAHV